uniref:Cytosol aminopeptidase domain-containing protein n=1 Tax=Mucochytrium quahogii TaxID=96639 RepID=A0A7S2RMU2_9STRA|mmetsp:Transcript_8165/g.13180  ORF Transcript_8165/g.13180 Transcript_8165/m.13180 type:complete len:510 (+) Transcript_8165:104-1633(+)
MKVLYFDDSVPIGEKPENVAIVAHAASAFEGPLPKQLEAALVGDALTTLKHAAKKCKPSRDAGASVETFLTQDGKFQRVAICLLPAGKEARHEAPGHPHSTASLIKGAKGDGDLSVFFLLKDPKRETYSNCCAVPRAFSTYSHKSGKSSSDNKCKVYACTGQTVLSSTNMSATVKVADLEAIAQGIQDCAHIVDMPPNELHCTEYVRRAKEMFKDDKNVSIEVIAGEELEKKGLGGLYGVGKASCHPPAMVILSYNPPGAKKEETSVVMVGKGIVYDTGGLSIKSKTGMPGMKMDMGGSAGVLGAFHAITQTGGIQRPLHCILCIAENSVGDNATRPDDVHVMYSGKTVEINNTDAEGRLAMISGLAWAAKNLNPAYMINMATLTGAQGSATGVKHAAIFCNNDSLEKLAVDAGMASGDLTHPLPYAPSYFRPEFRSAVADMLNSQRNRGNAGCAAPATFISNHIEEYLEADKGWLHIDMASPAFINDRATGYGVALLFLVLRSLESNL